MSRAKNGTNGGLTKKEVEAIELIIRNVVSEMIDQQAFDQVARKAAQELIDQRERERSERWKARLRGWLNAVHKHFWTIFWGIVSSCVGGVILWSLLN